MRVRSEGERESEDESESAGVRESTQTTHACSQRRQRRAWPGSCSPQLRRLSRARPRYPVRLLKAVQFGDVMHRLST